MGRVLKEFRRAGLDSVGIRTLIPATSPSLGEKLASLADIEERVEYVLENLAVETYEERLKACLAIEWPSDISLPRLMLLIGAETYPLAEAWVAWALDQGMDVTLLAFDHPLQASFETAKHIAERFGIEPEAVGTVPEPCASLFSDSIPERIDVDVAIESCFEPLAECEWVLRRVREDLDRGISPPQIGIFVRDVEGYARLLDSAAERLEVPINLMRVSTAASNRCVRWLIRLLDSLAEPKPSSFYRALSETYSNLSPEERSATKSTLRDSLRFGDNAWAIFADGIAPLESGFWIQDAISLRGQCGQVKSRREWTDFLERVLEFKPLFAMQESSDDLDKRDAAAIRQLAEGFRQRMEVTPEEELDYGGFVDDLLAIATSIPEVHDRSLNAVRTSASPIALVGCECLYVIGLLEGVFPRRRSEDPILTDSDRAEIVATLGGRALSDSRTVARSERDLFLQLVAAPLRKLTLTYPTSSEERDNVPAFYLGEIERVCGHSLLRLHHPRGEWAPRVELANMADSDRRLAAILGSPLPPASSQTVTSDSLLDLIRATDDTTFSPKDLRDSLLCRFRFAARRMLGIRARAGSDPEGAARRAVESAQVDALGSIKDFEVALDRTFSAELDLLLGVVDERELALIRAAGKRLFAKLIESEERARELWAREPNTVSAPAWFDGGALANELDIRDRAPLKLSGRVESVGNRGRNKVVTVRGVSAELAAYHPNNAPDADKLVVGLYLAALRSVEAAVELVGAEGDRTFLVLERNESTPQADVKAGLRVASVDWRETGFFQDVKTLAKEALDRAKNNRFEADPGPHCIHCEYKELCRKSHEAVAEGE